MSGFALPTELTLLILGWVVEAPGALSTTFNSFFAPAQCDYVSQSTYGKEARATNVILLRVCKQWHALAKELLFKHISISTKQQLRTMRRVLRQTSLDIRCKTKRLDFGVKWTYTRSPEETIRILMDLFPLLPNLEILCIQGPYIAPTERDLATYLALHLPHLKLLRCEHGSMAFTNPPKFLETHHYLVLQGLQSFSGIWATRNVVLSSLISPLESTSLTSLSLKFEDHAILPTQFLKLPALRCFGAIGITLRNTGLLPFLDVHGPQITSLCLEFHYDDPSEFEKDILYRCSSVKEFVRQDQWLTNKIPATYPSVIHFGLTHTPHTMNFEQIGGARGYLNKKYHLDRFPNLRLVRLLVTDCETLPSHCTKENVEDLLYPRGAIRFEDGYGCSIPEPSAERLVEVTDDV